MDRVARGVISHYDARAERYDESLMHRTVAAEVAGLVVRAAGTEARVLDVGTGTGLVLRSLPSSALRLGVDLSPGMLRQARAAEPSIPFLRADAARLPVAAASLDALTCVTVLHLLPDPAAVMAEWARCLRPSGLAWTATFVPRSTPPRPRPGDPLLVRDHGAVATPSRLASLAEPVGLELVTAHESAHGADRLLVCCLRRHPAPPST